MKRKLLNAALFGAVLVAAPVSTFVSCADYDADINVLNKQIEDLSAIVDQKETVIKQQIAALEAQDKALADKDAALEEALKNCKAECAAALAQCKADCAAAREQLQKSIDELKDALKKANDKEAEDVAALMQKDKELQDAIDLAKERLSKAEGRLDAIEAQLPNFATKEQVADLQTQINAIKEDIKKINETLDKEVKRLDGRIDDLTKTLNETKTALETAIKANTTEINTLKDRLKDYETTIKALQDADAKLAKDLEEAVKAIRGGYTGSMKDLKDLIDALNTRVNGVEGRVDALETRVDGLDAEVAKNTKAIVDMLVRIVALEEDVYVLQNYVGTPAGEGVEATGLFKAIDDLKAEDVRLWTAINNVYTKGEVDALLVQKYNECLAAAKAYADQVAEAAKNAAIATSDAHTDAKISALRTELEGKIAEVRTELNNFKAEVARTYATKVELADAETRITAAYQAADAALKAELEAEISALDTALRALINEVALALSSEVKGFVLEPASYYEGIQAIEGTSYEYSKWDVTDPLNPVQAADITTQYCPEVIARYHVNPSAAVLSTDVNNYAYAVLDRVNRGVNTQLGPVVTKVAQEGGMLDVTLRLTDASANKTPQTHQDPCEVTVMALQYTNPAAKAANQVVTSDYAVLYLNPLQEVSLVSSADQNHEIGDAASFAEKDYVEYTATEYNIEEQIKTRFGGEDALSISDAKWPEGFTYRYTKVAGDVTYFSDITAEGVTKPQLPNGKPATTACIGKNMTVRIDVMHGDEVAEVGFYQLIITGEAIVETAPTVITDEIYAVACAPYAHPALSVDLDIKNVWDLIVEKTGETEAEVKAKYAVSLLSEGPVAQFKEYESAEGNLYYKQYAGKGTVTYNKTTGKVNWTIPYTDPAIAEEILSLTKDTKALTTYIRVRSIDAIGSDTYNEFYLPLTWKPEPIEFWGEYQPLHWEYTRVANQWQANGVTREEAELRLYADLKVSGTTPFTYNIPEKAMKGEIKTTFIGTAKDFKYVDEFTLTNAHFRFIEHPVEAARHYNVEMGDGIVSTYDITVSEDGASLLAAPHKGAIAPVVIATITPAGVVNLENNDVSRVLLNAFEKDDLAYGHTLCARVGYEVECCAGEVKVVDGDFDVRFIKPLTVIDDDINISDADDVESAGIIKTTVLNNIVCFNGYTLAERPMYKDVFVVGLNLGDVQDWKTNYDAAEDDFSKSLLDNHINGLFDKDEATGEITYKCNTAVVSDFTVLVPVKVHYNWNLDPVETVIKLNVHRTLENSNRR